MPADRTEESITVFMNDAATSDHRVRMTAIEINVEHTRASILEYNRERRGRRRLIRQIWVVPRDCTA